MHAYELDRVEKRRICHMFSHQDGLQVKTTYNQRRRKSSCWRYVFVIYVFLLAATRMLKVMARLKTNAIVYPKKYAHGFFFAVLCCGYTLTDFPISIRLTSLALWQSDDCPSASKATLMNMDKYFIWIHYERLHNHNKAKHNKTVCIFLGIYCMILPVPVK